MVNQQTSPTPTNNSEGKKSERNYRIIRIPPPSLMFNSELDSCFDPNRPAVLRDSIELALSIKLIVSGDGFFIFFGNVNDARLMSIPDLLNLVPRCFCFSLAVESHVMIIFSYEKECTVSPQYLWHSSAYLD